LLEFVEIGGIVQ